MARQYQTVGAFINETGTRQYQRVGAFSNETVSVVSAVELLPASWTWTANDLTPVAGASSVALVAPSLTWVANDLNPLAPTAVALMPASWKWAAFDLTPVGGPAPPLNDCDRCESDIENVGSAIVAAGYRLPPTLVGDCRRVRKG